MKGVEVKALGPRVPPVPIFKVLAPRIKVPVPVAMALPLKVAAPTLPVPLIWTPELAPTENRDRGEVVPIPICPLSKIVELVRPVAPHLAR